MLKTGKEMRGKRDWNIHSTWSISKFYAFCLFTCFLNEIFTGTHRLPKGKDRKVTANILNGLKMNIHYIYSQLLTYRCIQQQTKNNKISNFPHRLHKYTGFSISFVVSCISCHTINTFSNILSVAQV